MGYLQTFDDVSRRLFAVWNPPPDLTISEWADRYGVLTASSSAEPGRWQTHSYQRAIMDAFCDPKVEEVVCMKSKRIGWTKIIGHVLGYHIHQDPCSVLIVQPTISDAEGYSKEEVATTIEETEVLRKLVGDAKSRSSGNTIRKKRYPGGMLHLVGANVPTGFRRITVRVVLFDEVDGYDRASVEGDQIKLGMGRSETFWNRKHGIGSTPTIKGVSRIEKRWNASSRGHPILMCPHCGGEHIRRFKPPDEPVMVRGVPVAVAHLKWDEGNPGSAVWTCPSCGAGIDHSFHRHMLMGMKWRGEHWDWTAQDGFFFHPGFAGRIGFSIWAGYSMSPNATPAKIAQEYEDARHNPEEMIVFTNTVLGEPWEEEGEELNAHALLERVEKYSADAPLGVRFLSAGVDVQIDRIEMDVVGWGGEGEESWSVDYVILPGDPSQPDVWRDLGDALRATYRHESGAMLRIGATGIDRGYLPKQVDAFIAGFKAGYVWGLNGRGGFGRPVVETKETRAKRLRKMRKMKTPREIIGVDDAKLVLHRRLRGITKAGPGYCHFGAHCDQEYFEQLTGEKLVTHYKRSGVELEWVKTRPRVEALDCRNYAYAALLLAEPNLQIEVVAPKTRKIVKTTPRRANFVSAWKN